jgi:hypothetical protein
MNIVKSPQLSQSNPRHGIARALSAIAVVPLLFVLGCSRSAQTPASREFFVEWLKSHGETNIVVDSKGVGIAGSPTRLRSSLYGSEKQRNGSISAETEFRVHLPGGREIVEFVAGSGDTLEAAEKDGKLNFLLTTFHVVYRSFMNPADPHQTEETVTINGKPRVLVLGDSMTRSGATNSSPDMFPLRSRFREMLSPLLLSPEPHWVKIVFAQNQNRVVMCAVTLDNQDNAALTEIVRKLPWPVQQDFYMVKQFIVVK